MLLGLARLKALPAYALFTDRSSVRIEWQPEERPRQSVDVRFGDGSILVTAPEHPPIEIAAQPTETLRVRLGAALHDAFTLAIHPVSRL